MISCPARRPARRDVLKLALLPACSLLGCALRPRAATLQSDLPQLEARAGGRLGVCVLDTGTGETVGQRLDERFAMCSTFKLPLVAAILREVDAGRLHLSQVLRYSAADLVPNSPVTEQHVSEGGLPLWRVAEAAQTQSDNLAANLLLAPLGGPAGFTAILRGLGDAETRLDRSEPMMNLHLPGEILDTTTPRAMAGTVARLLTGEILKSDSRDLLLSWMTATRTGQRRLRAGLPRGWRAGDKTGTGMGPGMTDKYSDVAIAWPPGRMPIVIAAYYDTAHHAEHMRDDDQAVLAEVGRFAAAWATRGGAR